MLGTHLASLGGCPRIHPKRGRSAIVSSRSAIVSSRSAIVSWRSAIVSWRSAIVSSIFGPILSPFPWGSPGRKVIRGPRAHNRRPFAALLNRCCSKTRDFVHTFPRKDANRCADLPSESLNTKNWPNKCRTKCADLPKVWVKCCNNARARTLHTISLPPTTYHPTPPSLRAVWPH